ncbi:GGDEF domain-containing protein [Baekduia alba]|uniref:GGDEF domain-containing protein n=1 Tax=Baekduia alba TaxID=2997333 RepID=UPI0023413160|nr:GGDEF domain-containing protein [Baekduia alba]
MPAAPIPAPVIAAPPKRWPWLALALIVGVAAISVLTALHQREQNARRAEMQATLFATELRDSVREITVFGNATPDRDLTRVLRPVIASTARTASARVARLDRLLGGDPRTDRLTAQLLQIRQVAATTSGPIAFGVRLNAQADRMARTADAIARDQRARATLIARETIAGGALAVLLSLAIVALVLQRAQRLLVAAGLRQAAQLQELAESDPLTGLANRRRLADDLARLRALTTPGAPVQVVICDLDGFKALNDTLGHEAGDELLVRFAAHLTAAAGDRGEAYRLGGDEFCVLSRPGLDVAGPIRAALAGDADLPVRGSAGLALWPTEAPSARAAMRLADERMYAVKASRRRAASAAA